METKKEFKYFTIFNHKKEEEYLRKMHKDGWKLVKTTGMGTFHFEKCKPCDVVYQLDYNPQTKETKEEYIKIFSDCGWEYVQDCGGYSYFRKPAEEMTGDETGIFNDDDSRVAMMARVYKGRLMPLITIFLCCLLPQFILGLLRGNVFITYFIGTILVIYIAFFVICAVCHAKMMKK